MNLEFKFPVRSMQFRQAAVFPARPKVLYTIHTRLIFQALEIPKRNMAHQERSNAQLCLLRLLRARDANVDPAN